ncbi:vascular cell adhesion protein 1 [Alosa sapidissima]|uniref:vascular cell adhesion protein 1 n=1 Tax=Alosa sapidissima TaxID=34773 RepID=UPI001C094200|nr:vascular cell adhesion protein 1 [Alosa sapidissima]
MLALWAMIVPLLASSVVVQIDKPDPVLVEFGGTVDLNCTATGCPEQPSFTWRPVDDKPFKLIKEENGFVSFKSQALTNIEMVCSVMCNQTRPLTRKRKIVVYSFPSDPEISGEDNLTVGVKQTVTCTARNLYPDEVSVEWVHGNMSVEGRNFIHKEQAGTSTVSSKYIFTPTALDNGGNITCKVIQIIPAGHGKSSNITRTRSAPLTVNLNYLRNIIISGEQNLTIGKTLSLTCNSDGNPLPVPVWTKAGKVLDSTNISTIVITNITWSHAGQYDCEANNTAGSVKSSVTVIIQGPPGGTQVSVSPSAEMLSGQNVTISCTALSFPPATFTLFRQGHRQPLQSGDGTFHLLHLTHEDTGLYLINITNHLGYVMETFQLSVASSPVLPAAVLPTVGSASLLTALVLLLRFLRSRKHSNDIGNGMVDIVENAL